MTFGHSPIRENPKTLPCTVLETKTRSIYLGVGNGASRRRWAFSTKLLLPFALVVLFHCSIGRKANSTDVTTKTRTLCCASSGGPFLPTNLYSSDESRGFSPHRNASVFGFKDRRISFCSPSDKSQCALCPSRSIVIGASISNDELKPLVSDLSPTKPPRVAPILQTGVRSRSFTGTDSKFFGILSFPTCRKVMLFSLPSILLDGGSLPLRRSSTGDLFHGTDERPKSFVIRPMLTALIELPEGLPGSVLIRSFSSFEEKLLPPYLLSIERGVSSVSLLSVCFSFLIVLLSCVAVSTGPEDANEITSIFLVDEVWTLTSHYVTILPLFDFVVKVPSTHSSTVLNSLSSSIEDLSCLVYLCVVCYVYGQRGWIIPSIYCSDQV
ncbi:LOW QUALITY PROTEIN: hypothetical protein HID58_089809 [Brassica napus]|uniref:Uncharacterized protein n=1 Tax=Brassica napus TaxID=3708 RepID=A0ABQ7Y048_BRANA|nr:LOW QUALITY PROTEIN: hypothetical protein HID58_089809 [Brassica napus]